MMMDIKEIFSMMDKLDSSFILNEETMFLLEATRDEIYDVYYDEQNGRAKNIARQTYDVICNMDPTARQDQVGPFAKWIFNMWDTSRMNESVLEEYMGKPEMFAEDAKTFVKLKNVKCPYVEHDLNKYDLNTFKERMNLARENDWDKSKKELSNSGMILLYEDQDWKVLVPLTYEIEKKYGAGTAWCTAPNNETYNSYTRDGSKLVIIVNKNEPITTNGNEYSSSNRNPKRKYQILIHKEGYINVDARWECCDANDNHFYYKAEFPSKIIEIIDSYASNVKKQYSARFNNVKECLKKYDKTFKEDELGLSANEEGIKYFVKNEYDGFIEICKLDNENKYTRNCIHLMFDSSKNDFLNIDGTISFEEINPLFLDNFKLFKVTIDKEKKIYNYSKNKILDLGIDNISYIDRSSMPNCIRICVPSERYSYYNSYYEYNLEKEDFITISGDKDIGTIYRIRDNVWCSYKYDSEMRFFDYNTMEYIGEPYKAESRWVNSNIIDNKWLIISFKSNRNVIMNIKDKKIISFTKSRTARDFNKLYEDYYIYEISSKNKIIVKGENCDFLKNAKGKPIPFSDIVCLNDGIVLVKSKNDEVYRILNLYTGKIEETSMQLTDLYGTYRYTNIGAVCSVLDNGFSPLIYFNTKTNNVDFIKVGNTAEYDIYNGCVYRCFNDGNVESTLYKIILKSGNASLCYMENIDGEKRLVPIVAGGNKKFKKIEAVGRNIISLKVDDGEIYVAGFVNGGNCEKIYGTLTLSSLGKVNSVRTSGYYSYNNPYFIDEKYYSSSNLGNEIFGGGELYNIDSNGLRGSFNY